MTQIIFVLFFAVIAPFKFIVVADIPRFRILAPQLVCPKDEKSPIVKPDYTVITIQTKSEAEFFMQWTVRWYPLKAPTQRFTVMLWRAVRALEAKLNGPQADPYVYIIRNEELLYGVKYIFTVTAKSLAGETAQPKSFYINNTYGEQTLEALDGLTDMMSVVLVGGQTTFVDITYVLEAEITTCAPMHDYHFLWNIRSEDLKESLNFSTTGSRLEIPPYSLQPGIVYDVTCFILKDATKETITQIELPLEVEYRCLEVYLSVDRLIVGIHQSFTLESIVISHDYLDSPLSFEWLCSIDEQTCDFFEGSNESSITLPSGLPFTGGYEITVIVRVQHQSAETKAIIIAVAAILPKIQVEPSPRLLNEGTTMNLIANVSDVVPSCTLTWYFTTDTELSNFSINSTDEQHGTPITDPVTIFSLEHNFLSELADYTNETQWRQVAVEYMASAGKARFVAECNCSVSFGCGTKEVVYADVHIKLNKGPKPADVRVSPSSGIALETIFHISTRAASDPDGPLRYSFYCRIGNYSHMLESYLEHLGVDTLLPYVESGLLVWVEVCDVLGACSSTEPKVVNVSKGEGRSANFLIDEVGAYIKRCEMIPLQRTAIMVISTYNNAGQMEPLKVFTAFLIDHLPTFPKRCISQYQEYLDFLGQLAYVGLDLLEHD